MRLPIGVTGINTIVLLFSGLCHDTGAVAQRVRIARKELRRWLLATGILGAIFLVVQGSEWVRLVHHGFTLSSGIYGSIFYVLIGCHALHALVAVCLGVERFLPRHWVDGKYSIDRHVGVEICAIYWTFVVVLWPILYVTGLFGLNVLLGRSDLQVAPSLLASTVCRSDLRIATFCCCVIAFLLK